MREEPNRKDEDRFLQTTGAASPSGAPRALGMARTLSPCTDLDFLFPSIRLEGTVPLSLDSILEKSIRPAIARNGVVGKQIGWHSFRHSLATNLRTIGVDIKVTQELMRHSNCRTTFGRLPKT
jgi:site-specific recombinase XerD